MSRVEGKLARMEQALHAKQRRKGSVEYHFPQGDGEASSSRLQPCDLREEHGPDCVMTVSPTNSGVRFMRIIHGIYD